MNLTRKQRAKPFSAYARCAYPTPTDGNLPPRRSHQIQVFRVIPRITRFTTGGHIGKAIGVTTGLGGWQFSTKRGWQFCIFGGGSSARWGWRFFVDKATYVQAYPQWDCNDGLNERIDSAHTKQTRTQRRRHAARCVEVGEIGFELQRWSNRRADVSGSAQLPEQNTDAARRRPHGTRGRRGGSGSAMVVERLSRLRRSRAHRGRRSH